MEPNDSRSLDWKTCFKKILAPHLLNPSEEQNDAFQNTVKPTNDVCSNTYLNNPEKLAKVQTKKNSSIALESVFADDSQSLIDGCQDGKLNNTENSFEAEENIANIIAADAEELGKSFKALKFRKKDKYYFNKAEPSRNAPDWNIAFKKVLDPKSVPDSSLKIPEEFVEKKPYLVSKQEALLHPELLDSWETNPWTYHKRHYSEEEKKVLDILRQARTFKRLPKPHMNIFDGAGVNCFKNSEIKSSTKSRSSNTKKPKNVPPPGGWVCIKPLTVEEVRKRPPNIISSECWDWDEDG